MCNSLRMAMMLLIPFSSSLHLISLSPFPSAPADHPRQFVVSCKKPLTDRKRDRKGFVVKPKTSHPSAEFLGAFSTLGSEIAVDQITECKSEP